MMNHYFFLVLIVCLSVYCHIYVVGFTSLIPTKAFRKSTKHSKLSWPLNSDNLHIIGDEQSSLLASDVSSFGINTALAEEHIALGNLENAQILAEKAMMLANHTHEKNNIYFAYAEGILGESLYHMGAYQEAADHFRSALKAYEHHKESSNGPETIEFCGAMQLVAWTLLSNKEYQDAKRACTLALSITEKLLGSHAPDTAASLINLASANLGIGNLGADTEAYYKRALNIYEKLIEQTDNQEAEMEFQEAIGGIHSSLGHLYNLRGNEDKALEEYKIVEFMYSTGDFCTGTAVPALKNLGLILWKKDDIKGAELMFSRALLLTETSPEYGTIHEQHQKLKVLLSKLRRGEKYQHQQHQ